MTNARLVIGKFISRHIYGACRFGVAMLGNFYSDIFYGVCRFVPHARSYVGGRRVPEGGSRGEFFGLFFGIDVTHATLRRFLRD